MHSREQHLDFPSPQREVRMLGTRRRTSDVQAVD